jgi:hypothetical protein
VKISRPVSFGMGAVMALVIGSGTAYAATGGKFILGKSNAATATTKLTNSRGTALALSAKSGKPALTVNTTTKVPNLNADRIDGLDSTSFALASGNVKAYDVSGQAIDSDSNGLTDAIGASATCPSGTRRTGGGMADFTTSGYTIVNGPDTGNSWTVIVGVDESVTEAPTDVTLSIVCYSPRSTPSGGYRTAGPVVTKPSAAVIAKAARKISAHR